VIDESRNQDSFFRRYQPRSAAHQPKYQVLRETMIRAIHDGLWPPGHRLPTENELVAITGYSLGTVQRALRALVEEGYVTRRQGRGSFVEHGPRPFGSPWHLRFLHESGREYLPVHSSVLQTQRIDKPGPWSRYIGGNDGPVLRLDRLLSVNREFNVYSEMYLESHRFGSLVETLRGAFDDSEFGALLATQFRLPITHLAESLVIATLPGRVCDILGIERDTTGMRMEAIARAGTEQFIYYQELFLPPTQRRLYTSLSGREPERRTRLWLHP